MPIKSPLDPILMAQLKGKAASDGQDNVKRDMQIPSAPQKDPATSETIAKKMTESITVKAGSSKSVIQKKVPQTPTFSKVNSSYADLSEETISVRVDARTWSNDELKKIPIYEVNQLNISQCISAGRSLIEMINANRITTETINLILILAISMRRPMSTDLNSMLMIKPTSDIGHSQGTISYDLSSSTVAANKTIDEAIMRQTKNMEAADTTEDKQKYADAIESLKAQKGSGNATTAEEYNEKESAVYCFIAAYMLRLYSKTTETWMDRWTNAKNRFSLWYDYNSKVMENLILTAEMVMNIKDAMARKPEICSTWVLWVAYNENENMTLGQHGLGVLKYIAAQMFAFTGMHSYAFIIQIQAATKVPFSLLLTELDCPMTRDAVRAVADIIRLHEVTARNPNRKTYFRYARVWNPGYFVKLQTSQCKMLAYVLARTRQAFAAGNEVMQPTTIFALRGMSEELKRTLDKVAHKLYQKIISYITNDSEAGEIWSSIGEGFNPMMT